MINNIRFEYTFFYTFMAGYDNLFCSLAAVDPYHFTRFTLHHRIAQRLLEGASPQVKRIFACDPFPSSPPKYVRVAVCIFINTTLFFSSSSLSLSFLLSFFLIIFLSPHSLLLSSFILEDMFEPQPLGSPTKYKRSFMHMQLPKMESSPHKWNDSVIDPFLWHFDLVVWRDSYLLLNIIIIIIICCIYCLIHISDMRVFGEK